MTDPRLFTRTEASEQLRIKDRTLRRLIASIEEFSGRRMTRLTAADIAIIGEAHQCRSMSRDAAPVSGTRVARSGRAAKASPSKNDPRDAVRALTRTLLRRDGTASSAIGSSKAERPRS